MNNTLKKILAITLTCALTLGLTACNQSGDTPTGTNSNEGTGGDISFEEGTAPPIDQNAPTGHLVYLTYETNFETSNEENLTKFESQYGGTIEVSLTGSGNEYFDKLGTMVSTGTSPDLVRYEWRSFPHAMSYNVYTALDSYIDANSDLWKDIKDVADQFMYNGKHYYFPYQLKTNFCLNYNALTFQEANLTDPMELLEKNQWTWSAFEQLITDWCNKDSNHIGYNGVGGMAFVLTTGKKVVDVKDDVITCNLKDQDVTRCMQWLEKLHKNGLTGVTEAQNTETGHSNGYEAPDAAFIDGNLLFLGMDPSWTYPAAKEALDKKGIDNEMKFVPFPRDDNSDTYYHGIDTFGYLIPSGAPNVKGAVDWINFLRTEEIDPENMAKAKDNATDDTPVYKAKCSNKDCGDTSENADSKGRHVYTAEEDEQGIIECPSCGTPREEKYKVVWDPDVYDLWMELKSTDGRFTMLFDNCYGFNDDLTTMFQGGETPLIDGPVFGDFSYTQLVEKNSSTVEAYLNEYRELMKQNAAGNLATMPLETEPAVSGTAASTGDTANTTASTN